MNRSSAFTPSLPQRRWQRAALAIVSAALVASGSAGQAQDRGSDFTSYVQSLWPQARDKGVSRATFDAMASGLSYNPRVIALDRDNLAGGATASNPIPPFAPYRARHVDAARIGGGRAAYARLAPLLGRIERNTGVPAQVMIAIYGHETAYGKVTGTFDLPQALATLAFDGRRRSLFEPELIATMQMVEQGVPRSALTGSWAGAFGYPQFLPSVYLRVARDGDGDGKARIWASEADAIASIGWYLHQAGWRRGEPWGVAVRVPGDFDRSAQASRLQPTRCPRVFARHTRWRSMAEWRRAGIVSENGSWPGDTVQATLMEPDGPGKTAYLLTGNYRAILDYNCSNFYALSVGLLADEIKR
jgi:membrane-bound lytic murein transglycosylase B